ncbi:MAG: acyltransferase 3 [Cypionkella sp.]|uniref:acyltransferase family protein n=1 Tax=Cypionkella sp. TaxID=2811411 RepID=UPI0026173CFD|nr:acyltransferase [Cypionkella sp.]MDB5661581.1 acyltransferase 3 [Cypionkella sp.]
MIVTLVATALLFPLVTCWLMIKVGFAPALPNGHRVGAIDGLRGYLSLLVVVHHFAVWQVFIDTGIWSAPEDNFLSNAGSGGVVLFFMVSGALFYSILDRQHGTVEWAPLYLSRLFRILPLMWAAVMALVIIGVMRGGSLTSGDIMPLARWLSLLGTPAIMDGTIMRNDIAGVLWTLRVEWLFYVSLPAVATFQKMVKGPHTRVFLLVIFCLALMTVRGLNIGPRPPMFFALGGLAIEIIKNSAWSTALLSTPATWVSLTCMAIAFLMVPYIYSPVGGGLLFIVFLTVVAGNDHFGVLSTKFSRMLGEVSYGIYLLHGIVLTVLFQDLGAASLPPSERWLLLPCVSIALVLIATLSFVTIERPWNRRGKNIGRRFSRKSSEPKHFVSS